MNDTPPYIPPVLSLEQLLLREDTWMGHSQRFTTRAAVATGYEALDGALLNRGWPLGSLMEVCQQGMQGEWQLFMPALLELPDLVVLVNPPAAPFSQAFIQAGMDLERLIVVDAPGKNHFLACFLELMRASVGAVLAWQPHEALTYTELRKCLLAAGEDSGLSVIFRPRNAQQQSSPASLRLFAQMIPTGLEVTVFKQKGQLQTRQARPIVLPLPSGWKTRPAYHLLNQPATDGKPTSRDAPRLASVTTLRGKP